MDKKLDRASILETQDITRQEVQIEEWGGSVFVKKMSGTERDAFEVGNSRADLKNCRARAAVLTVCDESGTPLFKMSDLDALGAKCASALDKIWDVMIKLNQIKPDDVETIEKNS